ncbi:MAG: metalloregulator ArsR/SmtB family transcription factor [Pseudohongiellaceae bacterium]
MKLRRDPFQAIADPTRRAILILLASHTMTAGAIASHFDVARPTISKHIQVLSACELIEPSRQGREIFYELKVESLQEIDMWIEQCRKIWEARFSQLDTLLSTMNENAK